MTTAQLETLRSEALALSEPERAKLASDLVASLDGPKDSNLSEAWDIEICRRINEIEKDPSLLLEASEVLARARTRIRDQ
ncbi:MAG: addiction module protein [Halioglobus sp.]|nr:addiction module protein [Halioglobus sp.]